MILLFSLYSMGEENMFFSDTSKYSRLSLVQHVLWSSAFIYLPHKHRLARILMLSWLLKLNVDLGERPFDCQICMSKHIIFINIYTSYSMDRQFSQEYIYWFCCHYWECWSHIHWSIMLLNRNLHNRKWETLIKKLLTPIICTL